MRWLVWLLSWLLGALCWLPAIQLFYPVRQEDYPALSTKTAQRPTLEKTQTARLLAWHEQAWSDPAQRAKLTRTMRQRNAEWDFMERTFQVLAFTNIALRYPPQKERMLRLIQAIIKDTLRLEQTRGHHHFLMGYSRSGRFRAPSNRSLFVDGEITLMLGALQRLRPEPQRRKQIQQRVHSMIQQMKRSPVLSGESYPNEAWTFCNTTALSAIRLSDALHGTDHSAFLRRWVTIAKQKLLHQPTGLLVSSYTWDGQHKDGPEGSSLWMVIHNLRIVAPTFAVDQYRRARAALGRIFLGFGFSKEWPLQAPGRIDVDSGPIVPLLGASASASGLALLGASTMDDRPYLRALLRSLQLAAFPHTQGKLTRYLASNQVGDAVLLYAITQGPLWRWVLQKTRDTRSPAPSSTPTTKTSATSLPGSQPGGTR